MRTAPSRSRLPIAAVALPVAMAVALVAPVAAQDELPPDEPATALRVAVDGALGEHALLVAEVVRSGVAGGPDFEAAAGALQDNSAAIVGLLEEVHGAEAAEAFGEQWNNHVAYVVDYSRAVAADDEDAAALAAEQLDRYVRDFSGLLAEAMPVLPPDTVEGLIGEHVQQLEHVASFEDADFSEAYLAIRETYAHMFAVGDGLTIGIVGLFPDRFPGRFEAFSPATDLRIELHRLFGEHSYLAAFAMRAVLRGAPDVQGATDAVAANSTELRDTITQVYGAEAGEAFGVLWDRHVGAYVAYVTALAEDDEAATEAALAELDRYRTDFSAYVADANPFLSEAAFEALVGDHTEHLVDQADAYAAGDYADSYRIGGEAYAHAGELARNLGAAIADQFPLVFPDTASLTDGAASGPNAGHATATGVAAVALLAIVAAAIGLVVARRGRSGARRRAASEGG